MDPQLYYELMDSLTNTGLFNLNKSDLETEKIDQENVNRINLNISDGICQTFEVYRGNDPLGIRVYEAVQYYEFCGNENLMTFNDVCRLFDKDLIRNR